MSRFENTLPGDNKEPRPASMAEIKELIQIVRDQTGKQKAIQRIIELFVESENNGLSQDEILRQLNQENVTRSDDPEKIRQLVSEINAILRKANNPYGIHLMPEQETQKRPKYGGTWRFNKKLRVYRLS